MNIVTLNSIKNSIKITNKEMIKIEPFTIPTKTFGNWERLKSINDKRIITEIILTAHHEISDPSYKIEFEPNKAPYKEKPKLKIPNLVVSWFNEILRQNNFPEIILLLVKTIDGQPGIFLFKKENKKAPNST